MRGLYPRAWNTEMFFALADRLGLGAKQKIAEYSSGMKAKLGILSAVCHAPDPLVLDEPTNSLDPVMRFDVNRMIRDFGESGGKTVLFSSHIVNELEDFADRILLMRGGAIVFDCRTDSLKTDYCVGAMPEAEAPFGVPDNAVWPVSLFRTRRSEGVFPHIDCV